MKGLLGLAGLVLALVIVGLLVKKQLAATQIVVPAPTPATQPGPTGPDGMPVGKPQGQGARIEQQYKQALDAAMQKARPASDEN